MPLQIRRLRDNTFLPVCLGLAVAVMFLGVLELGLRLAYGSPPRKRLPDNFQYAHLDILKPYFKRTWSGWGRTTMSPQRRESQARSFSLPKPSGVLRIFIVGGSVATPFSFEGATKLEAFIGSALPGREVEVIACGMGAYDSRRESTVLREILDYQPDLVMLLSGNNEYHGNEVPHPRFAILDQYLSTYWIYQKMKTLVLSWGPERKDPISLMPEQANFYFEKNLRAMARMCRAREIALVLSTLGANLRDTPPTSWRPRLDEPLYFNALRTWEERKDRLAAEQFQLFLDRYPGDPLGHYYLAKSQDRLGEYRKARQNYSLAADFDQPGTRTSPARNEIIRRVAREEGAILSDLEKVFVTLSPQGIPGAEVFRDSCHWMQEYYPLVSLTTLRAVYAFNITHAAAALAPVAAWRWEWATGLEATLRKPTISPDIAAHYFDDTLHSALAAAIVMDRDQLSEESINLLQKTMRRDAIKFERMTRSKEGLNPLFEKHWFQDYKERVDKDWPAVLVHVGEAWRREGHADLALAKFTAAVILQSDYYQARLRRAIATADLGRWEEARSEFRSLTQEFPQRAEPRLWEGHFKRRHPHYNDQANEDRGRLAPYRDSR